MKLCKSIVGTMFTAGVVGGIGLVLVEQVRPGAAGALLSQAREGVGKLVDRQIDDPVALRQQITRLSEAYPEKIATAQRDLEQVDTEIAQVTRRLEESRLVVELARADIERLDEVIARARHAASANPGAIVLVRVDGQRLPVDRAAAERNAVRQTQATHEKVASDLERDLGYLRTQRERVADLVGRLSAEHAEFLAQIYSLDLQIEEIARNERMIAIMEQRQARWDELSAYEAHSLGQITGRVEQIRAEQARRLERLGGPDVERSYLESARQLLDATPSARSGGEIELSPAPGGSAGEVIELSPELGDGEVMSRR